MDSDRLLPSGITARLAQETDALAQAVLRLGGIGRSRYALTLHYYVQTPCMFIIKIISFNLHNIILIHVHTIHVKFRFVYISG